MKNLIRQNIYYFSAFLILLICGSFILILSNKEAVTLWVNNHYSIGGDYFFLRASSLGDLWFFCITLFILLIWKGWKVCLQGAVCVITTAVVVQFLKYIVFPGTPRPTLYFEGKEVLRLIEGVALLKTESFPSGHTAEAFALATFCALTFSHKKYHWILAVVAACVGYSRLYLSQHFVTDVYVGMIIGVVVTSLAYFVTEPYFKPTVKIPR